MERNGLGYPSILYLELWKDDFVRGIDFIILFVELSAHVAKDGYITIGLALMNLLEFQFTIGTRLK